MNIQKLPWRLVLALLFWCCFFCLSESLALEKLVPEPSRKQECMRIIQVLEKGHYLGKKVDQALGERSFDIYVQHLDPFRSLLTLSDITRYAKVRKKWGRELIQGNLFSAYGLYNLCRNRDEKRLKYTLGLIENWEKKLDFSSDSPLIVDRKERPWQASESALKELWKKELINYIISLKLDGTTSKEITKTLTKTYESRLARIAQANAADVFDLIMNSLAMAFDPHTQYFPPRASEDFDIHMSLSLEGIGAILQSEYEYTRVVRLLPKGPADKSKRLMPGDRIIGVGQGKKGEIVDTVGMRLDKVVRMIRGPKNTFVRLKIIPAKKQGTTKTVAIKRGKIKLEEQSAKKQVVSVEENGVRYKIGIIEVPNFYIDFNALHRGDKNYRSTTRDVKKLLFELKEENIDGLIIDLRDNGGGSLKEASELTGLFLRYGPMVQIKSSHGIAKLYDDDIHIYYTGPLMVMINRMSASASEIFAGAIKDYHRGIIVGSTSFGKGTVQEIRPLAVRSFLGDDFSDLGKLKITNAKFYRVSGKSTQHKGVEPDIFLPRIYPVKTTGESSLDWALPWDTIEKTRFRDYPSLDWIVRDLTRKYEKRSALDPGMTYLKDRIQFTEEIALQNSLSLNLKKRQDRHKNQESRELEMENTFRKAVGLSPVTSLHTSHESEKKENGKKDDAEAGNTDLFDYKEILLKQAEYIMADFIALSRKHGLTWK